MLDGLDQEAQINKYDIRHVNQRSSLVVSAYQRKHLERPPASLFFERLDMFRIGGINNKRLFASSAEIAFFWCHKNDGTFPWAAWSSVTWLAAKAAKAAKAAERPSGALQSAREFHFFFDEVQRKQTSGRRAGAGVVVVVCAL